MTDTPDPYKILQVDPEAEVEVIQAAYRRLAQKYHPDRSSGQAAIDRMEAINAAWETIGDPNGGGGGGRRDGGSQRRMGADRRPKRRASFDLARNSAGVQVPARGQPGTQGASGGASSPTPEASAPPPRSAPAGGPPPVQPRRAEP